MADLNPPRPSLVYQPGLDGLRALAVLAVMLYHGAVAFTPGGFLGVDVFFVLSGFLITSLLLLEFETTGGLDLPAFWGRRARRLLPALFLVLLVVLVYGAFLAGEAAESVRKDTLATLFYVSNWWFIFSGNPYFEQFQDPSPLTHTWSLAIEEQWYVLLPLVLVLLLPTVRDRRSWAAVFGALALLSAAVTVLLYQPAQDPSRAYYGTDSRLQALLAGACLACVLTPGAIETVRSTGRWLAPFALAGVVAMMVLVTDSSAWLYRGGFLLMAALSALLLASVLAHPDGVVGRALSWSPVVWVGKISYGLYLWHWPVYVFLSPARTGLSGMGLLLIRFAVTFGVATLSYYLLEIPIRRGAFARFSLRSRLAVLVAAPLAILGLVGVSAATARPPAPDSLEAIRDSATQPASPAPTGGESTLPAATIAPAEDVRALLTGDSVPLSLFAAYRGHEVKGLEVQPAVQFGCGMVPFDAALNGVEIPVRDECALWDRERKYRIAAKGGTLGVVYVGVWELNDRWIDGTEVPFTDPQWLEATIAAYEKVLRELQPVTPRLALVLGACNGAAEIDLPDAVLFQAGRDPAVVNDPRRIAAVNDAAREAVARSGLDVTVIDPQPFLCDGQTYRATIDGTKMHTDGVHFTKEGARLFWEWLGPRLLNAGRTTGATPSVPAP